MLFDLQGKRRRMVQVVYVLLAGSFLIGFVIFGVGSGGAGGIGDLFGSGGSNSAATSQYDDKIDAANQKLQQDPHDQQALLLLAMNEFFKGKAELGAPDPTTGIPSLTDSAHTDLGAAIDAWERYLRLAKKPDAGTAQSLVTAYILLNDAPGAVRTQEIIAKAKPSQSSYGALAQFLYIELKIPAGDAAAKKAVALAPPSVRKQTKQQLDQIATQARKLKKKQAKAPQGSGSTALQNPFGGVGGSSAPVPPGG
jgi:hypothetical protein